MANCYICADRNAEYRRNVNTGSSYGTYYGRKSTSSSTRVYYGIRSVCEDCASKIDYARQTRRLIGLIILAIILLIILFY